MLAAMPKNKGAEGNPGGQGAPLVRLHDDTAQAPTRAERRAGEMLKKGPKAKGARTIGGDYRAGGTVAGPPENDAPTLAELGITKAQSARWQKPAAVSGDRASRHVGGNFGGNT